MNRMINELNMLKGDIESSEVKQVIPFINGRISTQSPKEHLIQHCNNLEQYIALHFSGISQQEQRIKELEKSDASKEESSINYYNEMRKLQSKLQAYEEVLNKINVEVTRGNVTGIGIIGEYDEDLSMLDNIALKIYKLKQLTKESE